MLRPVKAQRVYPPKTIAAMTAAFDQVGEVIPNGGDMRRRLALIILRHVEHGVQDPQQLSERAFREFAGLGVDG